MKSGKKKDGRISTKAVHVTIHKLENPSLDYWIGKARKFRSNVSAVLVGLEENHQEGKGLHVHIVIQFTTRQDLSRKQFVEHFGSDSVHIAKKASKDAMVMALGYVSKTGNVKQYGDFMFRGVPLDPNPEVYRFQYQVKNIEDGLRYFEKVIKEHIKDEDIIEKFAEREDAIGRWLRQHVTHTNTLIKLAHTWNLKYRNSRKTGFKFYDWVKSEHALKQHYKVYLGDFPSIFAANLPADSKLKLEEDYAGHVDHDIAQIGLIVRRLEEAIKYGHKRPHKSLNLYLWSLAPSFGKTRLLRFLDDHLMAYRLPDDQYYVDYKNDVYTILVSDEAARFLQTKSYSHLKHIFEGGRVEFNRKGKTKVMKRDNPLIVLAENESFEDLMGRYFPDRYEKQVMDTRVLDLQLKSRATLHFLIDRCVATKNKPLPLFEAKK